MQEKDTRKFPGEVRRDPHNKVITLTKEQEEWLNECYPYAPDCWIAQQMGVSKSWVYFNGRARGLQKKFKNKQLRRNWIGDDAYIESFRAATEKKRKIIRMEKFRVLSGMNKKTKMYIVLKPFNNAQLLARRHALQRGYWYYKNADDTSGIRFNVYYSSETNRSRIIEKELLDNGFKVLEGSKL